MRLGAGTAVPCPYDLRCVRLVRGCFQGADRDELEAFAAACGEDLWEGLKGAGWVGDAVVEDDYGSGGVIFCYEPADVPDGRMHGIVRVGGAEGAFVAVGLG